MTSRPSTAAPILAVLAVVLVTLGAYVGGYMLLPTGSWHCPVGFVRQYSTDWQASAFWAASRVESWCVGQTVFAVGPELLNEFSDEDFYQ